MAPRNVYIAVIGTGGVGAAFLQQLAHLQATLRSAALHVVLISRQRTCLQASAFDAPLSLSDWTSALAASTTPPPVPAALAAWLRSAPGASILVDNTAAGAIAGAYADFIAAGVHVVTPNKLAFAGPAAAWATLQAALAQPGAGTCRHEATVGAGLPVLSTLADLQVTGDAVTRIQGVFSGTLSFLFNTFAPVGRTGAAGGAWSAAVATARARGFTEPDPRDDLNGMDVARKLTILARACGVAVEGPAAFPVQSLVPEGLATVATAEEFLQRLPEGDAEMEARREAAEREGKVVRFVGSLDVGKAELRVGLENVAVGSAVAGLQGSDNLICFYTRRYGDRPLVIQGAGAGADVTAMGVSADLVHIVKELA